MSIVTCFLRSMWNRMIAPRRVPLIVCVLASLLCAASGLAVGADKQGYRVGERLTQKSGAVGPYKDLPWESLVPAGWDPARELGTLDFGQLGDADPRAIKALEKLRQAWDNAPIVSSLNGTRVRIPGFVVPLEVQNRQIVEFLLVPYFGACIHTPPPPANQIIHVLPSKPLNHDKAMSAVWISGTLETVRTDSGMGSAGYWMRAETVVPYRKP
jgi:hypothetical protein